MRRLLTSIIFVSSVLFAFPAFAGDGSALLQYVPSNAQAVIGIDMTKLRGSPLWQSGMELADGNADLSRSIATIQNDAGFDPRETVTSVVLASTELSSDSGDHMVAFIETTYPAEGLASVLVQDGYEAGTVGDITYYRKSQSTVAFLTDGVLAVGEFAMVEPALNGSAGASGVVASQLGSVDRSGAIWVAAQLPSGSQGAQALRAAINLSAGFAAAVNVGMESADSAANGATQLNEWVAGAAAAPEVAAFGLAPVLAGLQASAADNEISINVSVDAAAFGEVVNRLSAVAQEELR